MIRQTTDFVRFLIVSIGSCLIDNFLNLFTQKQSDHVEANFITAIVVATAVTVSAVQMQQQKKAQAKAEKKADAQQKAMKQEALQAGEYWADITAKQATLQSLQGQTKMLSDIIKDKQDAKKIAAANPQPIVFVSPEKNIVDKINNSIDSFLG